MYKDGRELLSKVPEIQKDAFHTLPPTCAANFGRRSRSPDASATRRSATGNIGLMLANLKGSLYEKRAERWQKLPALTSEADNMCISCHEPGRLKPTAARLGITLDE
jgi:hypothetical protein